MDKKYYLELLYIMFLYIFTFLIVILVAYIVGLTIVTLIDKRLSNISINLPKQNVVVQLPENKIQEGFENCSTFEPKGFSAEFKNNQQKVDLAPPELCKTFCYQNHQHAICHPGTMNYPDPNTMTPIDKRYFKYNYADNFTKQDYINWLWLYKNSQEELPYEHLKNLNKLMKGNMDITQPPSFISVPTSTADYFRKMYNQELNIDEPLNTELYGLQGANVVQYPSPVIIYDKYQQPYERKRIIPNVHFP